MTDIQVGSGRAVGLNSVAAGATEYLSFPVGQTTQRASATESYLQTTVRTAGNISNPWIHVASNDMTGASYFKMRVNGADVASVTIAAESGAGDFEDTDSFAISAGDEINAAISVGSGGSTFTHGSIGAIFTPSSGSVQRLCAQRGGANFNVESSTAYFTPAGTTNALTGTGGREGEILTAGTLKNFQVNISSNARTTNNIYGVSINGTKATDLKVTITPTDGAGIYEDTAHTASVSVDDEIEFYCETGTGTEDQRAYGVSCDFEATDSTKWQFMSGGDSVDTLAEETTYYYPIMGDFDSTFTSETDMHLETQVAFTASLPTANLYANTIDGDSTVTLRVDGADTTISLLIAGDSGSGAFQDATDSASISAGSDLNWKIVTGSTVSGNMSFLTLQLLCTSVSTSVSVNVSDSATIAENLDINLTKLNLSIFDSVSIEEALD